LKSHAAAGTLQRNRGGSALTRPLAAIVFFTFALGLKTTHLLALVEGQNSVVRVPMHEIAGEEVVQVSINGTGPYDFILDTGSNVTVVRSQLIRKLNLLSGAPTAILTATGETRGQRVIIDNIAVAGLAVEHLEIDVVDRAQVLNGRVEGILGENFLKNFDILIDNEQQTLFIDRTSSLEGSVAGERLGFSRFGSSDDKPTTDRIVIELKVPSFTGKPLLFLVDSGINAAVLYPSPGGQALRAMQSSEYVSMDDLNQRRECQIQKANFEIGGGTFRGLQLVACEGLTRNEMDTDGLLPTRVFHRFFISHRGGYVIANPRSLEKPGDSFVQLSGDK
jgi:Aspartyl protease